MFRGSLYVRPHHFILRLAIATTSQRLSKEVVFIFTA